MNLKYTTCSQKYSLKNQRGFSPLKNQKGFSFIEAILATVVLSFGMFGSLTLIQSATANSNYNDMRVVATNLATQKIEQIVSDKSFKGYDWIADENYTVEQLSASNAGFSRSVSVNEVDSSDLTTPEVGSGFKKVDISVTWGDEAYESITVSSIVTDY